MKNLIKQIIKESIRNMLIENEFPNQTLLGKPILGTYSNEADNEYEKEIGFYIGDGYIALRNLKYNEKLGLYIVSNNTYIIYDDGENYFRNSLNPYEINDKVIDEAIFSDKEELKKFFNLLKSLNTLKFNANFNNVVTKDFAKKTRKPLNLNKYDNYSFTYRGDEYTLDTSENKLGEYSNRVTLEFKSGQGFDSNSIYVTISYSYDVMGKLIKPDVRVDYYFGFMSKGEEIKPTSEITYLVNNIISNLK
jgi:hypothetical protein